MFRNLNLSELIEIRKAKYCVRSEPVESYLDLSDFGIVDPHHETIRLIFSLVLFVQGIFL